MVHLLITRVMTDGKNMDPARAMEIYQPANPIVWQKIKAGSLGGNIRWDRVIQCPDQTFAAAACDAIWPIVPMEILPVIYSKDNG
jgi:hypothetical protein